MKEFYKIDLETGIVIDTCLFDDEVDTIPDDVKLGWGGNRGFHEPIYDFTIDDWVESKDLRIILDDSISRKFEELSNSCQQAILGYFKAIVDGVEYDFSFDREAQANFTGTMIFLGNGLIQTVEWTAWKDGVSQRVVLTKDQFMQIVGIAFSHKDGKISRLRNDLQIQLKNCQSVEEVNAINW